jgi:hypothetical protein
LSFLKEKDFTKRAVALGGQGLRGSFFTVIIKLDVGRSSYRV